METDQLIDEAKTVMDVHKRLVTKRRKSISSSGDPREELRRLVQQHIVWRTLEGLEVWPSYYAAKLGYEHGGKISVNAPRKLTVEEAIALVGDFEGHAYDWEKSVL